MDDEEEEFVIVEDSSTDSEDEEEDEVQKHNYLQCSYVALFIAIVTLTLRVWDSAIQQNLMKVLQ